MLGFSSFASIALCLAVALALDHRTSAASTSVAVSRETGIGLSVNDDGSFGITTRFQGWTFSGNVGSVIAELASRPGRDLAGRYQEVEFKYATSNGAARLGAIRVYHHRPVVVFKLTFLTAGKTSESFPSISSYPQNLHHLAYTSVFGGYSFERFGTDGPWVFFDDSANTFILSPASHYMNASLSLGPQDELRSTIIADGDAIPVRFVQTTALVIDAGINRAFETWGRFLTDLAGKRRPANDADFSLKYLGYWTDNGAAYYYRFEDELGYVGTLLGVRNEFKKMNIRLGYVQLDSWFYPKGHEGKWKSADPLGGGTYFYEGSRELFPGGLAAFQKQLGLPLIVHNRWIDDNRPYRKTRAISGNVSIDPKLWAQWMRYIRAAGARTYEQDWLSGPATPERDLGAGELFMDLMSDAARKEGIALQYCMPLPRHFLQGTRYSNLLTIRVSGDRFEKAQWKPFLFNGRLASALGEWPWTDVFKSSETSNVLLSTLSGSIVGVGDAIGEFDRTNLQLVVRADGMVVKPDDPIVPLDSTYIEQANERQLPIVAAARTRHRGSVTSYVFAFAQGNEAHKATFSPAALGYDGPVYAYNYFEKRGVYLEPLQSISSVVSDDGAYWIVVPIGASGIGFLGEEGKFVSNGRNRIARIRDTGAFRAQIVFSRGERRLAFHGFAFHQPEAWATKAVVENFTYDPATRRFRFDLIAKPGTSPAVMLKASENAGRIRSASLGVPFHDHHRATPDIGHWRLLRDDDLQPERGHAARNRAGVHRRCSARLHADRLERPQPLSCRFQRQDCGARMDQ
jgi:hypothetical protein